VSGPNRVRSFLAFQFDINFTSGLLSATGITEGDFLAGSVQRFLFPAPLTMPPERRLLPLIRS